MSRDEDDQVVLGLRPPVPGEDPHSGYGQVDLVDNGAFTEIENLADDLADPVDVDENPFLVHAADEDGSPGFRPFVDASNTFEQQEGLEPQSEDNASEYEVIGDEFSERLKQRQDAAVGADGHPVGDLAMLAGVQQAQQKASEKVAPFVNTNPATAFRALLGGRFTVDVQKPPFQVINWVGEDVEAKPVTITLSPIIDSADTNYAQVASAYVMWGTRDGIQTAEIDIGHGIQFTLVASTIYVSIGLPSNYGVPGANQNVFGGTVNIAASMGFYTTAKNAALTKTNPMIRMDNTVVTAIVPRPAFASHIYFERQDPTTQWTLTFLDTSGIIAYERIVLANTYLSEVKLANDVNFVKVTTTAGGFSTYSARLIWGLYI
jgi:hypothetical protein